MPTRFVLAEDSYAAAVALARGGQRETRRAAGYSFVLIGVVLFARQVSTSSLTT